MNKEELKVILEKHEQWIKGIKDGERANLSYVNLRGADLRGANLRGADLRGADLSNANLSNANLSNANLRGADLRGADLSNADLRGADLRGASIQSVRGIKIYSIDNIGTFFGKVIFLPSENKVWAGCWSGTLDEFLEKGLEMNKNDERQLKNIEIAYEFFKNNIG